MSAPAQQNLSWLRDDVRLLKFAHWLLVQPVEPDSSARARAATLSNRVHHSRCSIPSGPLCRNPSSSTPLMSTFCVSPSPQVTRTPDRHSGVRVRIVGPP